MALTGVLGIGYEVVGIRTLAQVLENTVYTFAVVLAVYLGGTALGAAWFQRRGDRRASQPLLADLLCGLAVSVVLGAWAVTRAQPLYDFLRTRLGDGPLSVALAETLTAAPVFALPTFFMGATFSLLAQSARGSAGGVGRAVALNTLGGALAAPLSGIVLLPAIGARWTFVLIALGYLILLPRLWRRHWFLIALPVVYGFLLPADLRLAPVPLGGRLLAYREGIAASVAVTQDADGARALLVNRRFQMGGTATMSAERRHAHLPLLLHPAPRTALFLGLGTGVTFGAAGVHPGLRADGVELLPEVIDVMPQFEPENGAPARRPQLQLHVADARRFVRVTGQRYDVIVADLFHPAMDGAGALYTTEHFQAIRGRLAPGGLFCQWLPLHQLDEDTLRIIARTFLDVFPHARAWLLRFNVDTPVLGLIGTLEPAHYSAGWLEQRFGHPELDEQLAKLTLKDSIQLFGCFVAGPRELAAFAGAAPRNTDDHPVVIYRAPRFAYQKHRAPQERLFALLAGPRSDATELVEAASNDAGKFAKRINDFIAARDLYLNGLVRETEQNLAAALDTYVASAVRSADFTWGYARCLTIAQVYARTNPADARALLLRLVEAQPAQTRAKELLGRLGGP